jgi:hypothetical protein
MPKITERHKLKFKGNSYTRNMAVSDGDIEIAIDRSIARSADGYSDGRLETMGYSISATHKMMARMVELMIDKRVITTTEELETLLDHDFDIEQGE